MITEDQIFKIYISRQQLIQLIELLDEHGCGVDLIDLLDDLQLLYSEINNKEKDDA